VHVGRRDFIGLAVASVALGPAAGRAADAQTGAEGMYGLIGKLMATPGRRDELIQVLLDGSTSMPGCLSYIVAADSTDLNGIWITEAWDSEASHKASLSLPQVRAAIAKGKPLIAGFGERFVTTPLGGHGLTPPRTP
jgi:quinol monooxygenase YgiN